MRHYHHQFIPYSGPPGVHIPPPSSASMAMTTSAVNGVSPSSLSYPLPHQTVAATATTTQHPQHQQHQQHQPHPQHQKHQHQQHHHQHQQHQQQQQHSPPQQQQNSQHVHAQQQLSYPDPGTVAAASATPTASHYRHAPPMVIPPSTNPAASTSSSPTVVATTPDWAKDLVQLAKMSELKKHALTLQLHTAHILSAHASVQEKSRAIQDVREQKNKLDGERTRLISALAEINKHRDQADMAEANLNRECTEIRMKIDNLTESDYATVKAEVDRLGKELGQPPVPSLQKLLEEKTAQYLTDRRLGVEGPRRRPKSSGGDSDSPSKRPRGRPRGSKKKME